MLLRLFKYTITTPPQNKRKRSKKLADAIYMQWDPYVTPSALCIAIASFNALDCCCYLMRNAKEICIIVFA